MTARPLRVDPEIKTRPRALARHPLAVSLWVRLMKTHNLILREARRAVSADCTLPQFDVLAQLARARRGLIFRELSQQLLVSAGNLTGIVDRLEEEGLVYREVLAHDRRSFMIRLTGRGRQVANHLIRQHARDIQHILSVLPRKDQIQLRMLLIKAHQLLELNTTGPNGRRPKK